MTHNLWNLRIRFFIKPSRSGASNWNQQISKTLECALQKNAKWSEKKINLFCWVIEWKTIDIIKINLKIGVRILNSAYTQIKCSFSFHSHRESENDEKTTSEMISLEYLYTLFSSLLFLKQEMLTHNRGHIIRMSGVWNFDSFFWNRFQFE